MLIKRLWNHFVRFANQDEDYFHLIDILAKTYGCMPSDIRKMNWNDLFFNVKCLQARSMRLKKALKQSKRKKGMVFPNLSFNDMIDIIG